jgi:glycosyltransferase involved in cell wall biosynthesis
MYTIKYIYCALIGQQIPPWVHTLHTSAFRELTYFERKLSSKLYAKKIITPIAVSEKVAKSFLEEYSFPKVSTIHNGIPLCKINRGDKRAYRNKLHLDHKSLILISVARLASPKDPHLLVRAYSNFSKKYPQSKLILLGDGEYKTNLTNNINNMGLSNNIVLLGVKSNVQEYLYASDIFVHASNMEGLPISLLEAMATGLPVVASRVGGIPEVVTEPENGYLVPPANIHALSSALEKCAKQVLLHKDYSQNRKKIATSFSLERTVNKYLELYEHVIQ